MYINIIIECLTHKKVQRILIFRLTSLFLLIHLICLILY